jgi:hypothetical protein
MMDRRHTAHTPVFLVRCRSNSAPLWGQAGVDGMGGEGEVGEVGWDFGAGDGGGDEGGGGD